MQTGTAARRALAPAPPVLREFQYIEVGTGILSTVRGRAEVVAAAGLLALPLALPFALSVLAAKPARKPGVEDKPAERVVWLRPAPPKPREPEKSTAREPEREADRPVLEMPDETSDRKKPARVSIRFCPDREQVLPEVLAKAEGGVAYAANGLILRRFAPPGWNEIPVAEEGEALRGYYHLRILERTGRYRFLSEIAERSRGGEPPIESLEPFALVSWNQQVKVESEIEREASARCPADARVEALVCLDRAAVFRLSRIDCIRAENEARQ